MSQSNKNIIQEIDALIRGGKSSNAKELLTTLTTQEVAREHVVEIAGLARRCGLPFLGIKLLNPMVRPSLKSVNTATDAEKIEYAACLSFLGSGQEALTLLKSVDTATHPTALLTLVFGLVNQWRYEETLPLLYRFMENKSITEYQLLIAKVNIAAALSFCRRFDEARNLLVELENETSVKNYALLHGNALELLAQNSLFDGRLEFGRKTLQASKVALKESQGVEAQLIKKWETVFKLFENPNKPGALDPLREFRAKSLASEQWEFVRDCDRFEAIATRNEQLFMHVYFGTPFPEFRRRLMFDWGGEIQIPATYKRSLGLPTRNSPVVNLNEHFEIGSIEHNLFVFLTTDFYRPFSLGSLFSALYPDEFFHPETGPQRVRHVKRKLNDSFAKFKVPLLVSKGDEVTRLLESAPCYLEIGKSRELSSKSHAQIETLQSVFRNELFSAKDVEIKTGMSSSAVNRLLQKTVQEGVIEKIGSGRATQYQFKSKKPFAA